MDRAAAASLVAKLRAVTVERGASPAEARVAARKAAGLVERFRLDREPVRPRARRVPPRPAQTRGPVRPVWGSPPEVPSSWWFDASTGEGSENVNVKSYRNRANWRIEVDR